MSFLIGPAPIRRTLNHLKSSPLIFKERVKIMEIHYNYYWKHNLPRPSSDSHFGLRDFYFWNIDRIQYCNPDLQIVRFVETNPSPFIRCWLDNGQDVLFDCFFKNQHEIMNQLIKILGKSKEKLKDEKAKLMESSKENRAIFGFNRERFCICECEGQVPCPGVVPLPMKMRGKYKYYKKEELEEYENNLDLPEKTEQEMKEYSRWYPNVDKACETKIKNIERIQIGKQSGFNKEFLHAKSMKTYLEKIKERTNVNVKK